MVFSSVVFLFFFLPLALGTVWLAQEYVGPCKRTRIQNRVLLVLSLLFYSWGEPIYVLLIIGSIFTNFYLGKAIGRSDLKDRRKSLLIVAVTLNLVLLGITKYAAFLVLCLNELFVVLGFSPMTPPRIRLPIGISFFTFQALSYIVDVYKKKTPSQSELVNLGLYIALFPQLIAGPIVRYHDISRQLTNRRLSVESLAGGLRRFVVGLGKKILIANIMGEVADEIFALSSNEMSTILAWIGVIAFTIQIYFDFSGYSDMAIGLALCFGFRLRENFNYPYMATSIRDFWRRWHISLSSWFKDYLYIPLGGGRVSSLRVYRNQFVVFALCGLWHGASATFLLWGLYHGLFLTIERIGFGRFLSKIRWGSNVYTLLVVCVGWVLFRSDSFPQAMSFLKFMFGVSFCNTENLLHLKFLQNREVILAFVFSAIGSTPLVRDWFLKPRQHEKEDSTREAFLLITQDVYLGIVLFLSALYLSAGSYDPFIYFRF